MLFPTSQLQPRGRSRQPRKFPAIRTPRGLGSIGARPPSTDFFPEGYPAFLFIVLITPDNPNTTIFIVDDQVLWDEFGVLGRWSCLNFSIIHFLLAGTKQMFETIEMGWSRMTRVLLMGWSSELFSESFHGTARAAMGAPDRCCAAGSCSSSSLGACFNGLPSGKHTNSYWKWPFIVNVPIEHGDFL